jgi:HEAT repeat protein
MKAPDPVELDIDLSTFDENVATHIPGLIDSDTLTRKKARETLMVMGKDVLPQIYRLLASKNRVLRWEAAKIIELIGSKRSIPALLELLDDSESDIRWIAAEGLTKIGRRSIVPLLHVLINKNQSIYIRVGAHHVLNNLLNAKEKKELGTLLHSLSNLLESGEMLSVEVSKALKRSYK